MRIITTWIYFEASQVKLGGRYRDRPGRGEDNEPGIGIAWCAGDTTAMDSISNLKVFREFPVNAGEFSEDVLRRYIGAFLVEGRDYEFIRPEGTIPNASIVDYVLNAPFVIERSPPVLVSLKGVINTTNMPVWIGTYMGWSVAPEHSILLFVTIPGGIIVVSSAVGLADAIASGLNTSIRKLFFR